MHSKGLTKNMHATVVMQAHHREQEFLVENMPSSDLQSAQSEFGLWTTNMRAKNCLASQA